MLCQVSMSPDQGASVNIQLLPYFSRLFCTCRDERPDSSLTEKDFRTSVGDLVYDCSMLPGFYSSQGSVCCRGYVHEMMRPGSMNAMQAFRAPF